MKLYIKSSFAAILLLSLFVTGCLKDKDYDDRLIQSTRSEGTQKIVEISLTTTSTVNFLQISMANSTNDTTFRLVPVSLAADKPATEDIVVTVVPNPALIGNYNATAGTFYEEAPSAIYTITNTVAPGGGFLVTIPKGSNTGYLEIKIKPSNFLGHEYALGYQISSIQNAGYLISSNLSSGVAAVGIKNKYDGSYDLRIKTVGWTAYGIADGVAGDYPDPLFLITNSANSVRFFNPNSGDLQPAFSGTANVPGTIGGATAFGATTPLFTFDVATDKLISVTNTSPDDGRGRTLFLNTAVTDSRYDPATKTIYAAYIMTNTGRPNQFIYDTLTYNGPRP
jgi:hypothetical protein